MKRGTLRIYLGAAPGAGKTYAMLAEGHRRLARGTDVVVGLVETHGRLHTAELLAGLPAVPRLTRYHRGAAFTEMDTDAVVARRPQVVLVDELAHTNVPGGRHVKRWQDIGELLDAGIDVISTVNIQHLESLGEVVAAITGVQQRETVPDAFVRGADQIEVVDITPEALRKRMAHGNIYAATKIDAALANYFRPGNLTALRELSLLWLADQVDEGMQRYRVQHGIDRTWETRERVVVALTGGPEGGPLIRRGARIAARGRADLLAVHVSRSDGLTGADAAELATQRTLVESLGGTYHQVLGDDVPAALLDFARSENATQLVLGVSRRSRLQTFLAGPGIGVTTINGSGSIDVHLVGHQRAAGRGRIPGPGGELTWRRRWWALALAVVALPALTAILVPFRGVLTLPSDLLLFLLVVVTVAMVGGLGPALLAAVAGLLLLNFYFTPPLFTLTIADHNNLFALVVFIAVAVMVSSVVNVAARRARQAATAGAEAQTLATLAGSVLRGRSAVADLLEHVRGTFAQDHAALVRGDDREGWQLIEQAGHPEAVRRGGVDTAIPVADGVELRLRGRSLAAADRRVLAAFAAQIAVALEQRRLAEAAAAAAPVIQADRTRTALLAAVSHDLRTPLASAKAAVTGLRSTTVTLAMQEQAELLATAADSLDRLGALVENLLDMSRLQAGALSAFPRPLGPDDAVDHALREIGDAASAVTVEVTGDPPEISADPGLLERVLVNVISNAARYSPRGLPPRVLIGAVGDRVDIRVVDRGPGVPDDAKGTIFDAFQRRGDTDNTPGVGLGLALSRGLTEAMNGTLDAEDTPGGGLTMVISLPAAAARPGGVPVGSRESAGDAGTERSGGEALDGAGSPESARAAASPTADGAP